MNAIIKRTSKSKHWDVFISYATEDKDFVRGLADALQNLGLKVWFDEFNLKTGDSLRESLDYGLANSTYGIVVLSPNFFAKKEKWSKNELNALVARERIHNKRVVLPVWHNITVGELEKISPTLSEHIAVSTDLGLTYVVSKLLVAMEFHRENRMKPTFFISYSSRDSKDAELISNALQNSGFRTWLDKKDIVIGQPILDRVSKGIETESDFVIILMSKNSIDSEWCKLELRMAYQKELSLKRVVVLPIRIDDVDVPSEVLAKKYFQLSPHSKTSSIDSLIQEINSLLKRQ